MKRRLAVAESEISANSKETERRLAAFESKLSTISEALKHSQSEQKRLLGVTETLVRHKRAANQQMSVSDLDKRIITLESRYMYDKFDS